MKNVFLVAGLCCFAASARSCRATKSHAVAHVKALDGSAVGTIDFAQTNHGTLITFDLHGLRRARMPSTSTPPAIATRKRNSPAPVRISRPIRKSMAFMVKGGPHPGDLPNQCAAADGTLHASTISNCSRSATARNRSSTATAHRSSSTAKGDDYTSQPAGNSGDRVACGVIVRTVGPKARKGAKRKHACVIEACCAESKRIRRDAHASSDAHLRQLLQSAALRAHNSAFRWRLKDYGLHDGTTRTPDYLAQESERPRAVAGAGGWPLPAGVGRDPVVSRRRHNACPGTDKWHRAEALPVDVLRTIQPRAVRRRRAVLARLCAESRPRRRTPSRRRMA